MAVFLLRYLTSNIKRVALILCLCAMLVIYVSLEVCFIAHPAVADTERLYFVFIRCSFRKI